MLWAFAQPVAALGLAGGFLVGLGLRAVAQRCGVFVLGSGRSRPPVLASPRDDIDPIGIVSAVVAGTGWGRGAPSQPLATRGRAALAVLAGPAAAIAAGQLTLAAFAVACPADRTVLLVNHPSDILRGVVAPTPVAQLVLSVAAALLCFGLLALLPVPPLDGSRLARLLFTDEVGPPSSMMDLLGSAILLILAVVPVTGKLPPLLMLLDVVGTPLLRIWT